MAESSIASAIAVPDPEPEQTSSPKVLKRRQSEASEPEQDSKRQRISPGKNSPTAARDSASNDRPTENGGSAATKDKAADTREARRKSSITDEKQRSKRLFGALLGNLNQPSDRTSKRRQEIESRRKAELQRQDDERVEDKQRRREKLAEQRRREQSKVDEQNMRTRHSNMLNAANFLQTTSEPKLYYRPWDLRPDEEDRIDDQLRDAQAQIDKELDEFDQLRTQDSNTDDSNGAKDAISEHKGTLTSDTSRPEIESQNGARDKANKEDEAPAKSANTEDPKPPEVPESPDTDNRTNNQDHAKVRKSEEEMEEEVDHVVDGDEDTVIY